MLFEHPILTVARSPLAGSPVARLTLAGFKLAGLSLSRWNLALALSLTGLVSAGADEKPPVARPAVKVRAINILPAPIITIEAKAVPVQPGDAAVKVGVVANGEAAVVEAVEIRDAKVDVLAGPVIEAIGKKIVINAEALPAPNQALIQQYMQQYRAVLTSELAFVRQICHQLPLKDRIAIRAKGEASLREAARLTADQQVRNQRPVAGLRVRAASTELMSPRTVIRQGLSEALKQVLSQADWEVFSFEAEQRLLARKNAAITDAVARFDAALHFTVEQREKVTAGINSNWQDKWEEWLMIYMYSDQYYPMVPDQMILTHLSAEQRAIWPNLQRISIGFYERVEGVVAADDWWGPEPDPDPINAVNAIQIQVGQ